MPGSIIWLSAWGECVNKAREILNTASDMKLWKKGKSMSKQDFLDNLRRSLSSGLEYGNVEEHMRYYSDYIDSRLRQGEREEDILEELGDPRLIAKTLVGMGTGSGTTEEYVSEEQKMGSKRKSFRIHFNGKDYMLPSWMATLFGGIAAILAVCLVIILFTGALKIAFPILIIVFIVRFIRRLFLR